MLFKKNKKSLPKLCRGFCDDQDKPVPRKRNYSKLPIRAANDSLADAIFKAKGKKGK